MTGKKLCILSLHSEFGSFDALTSRLLSFFIFDDMLIPGITLAQIMDAWVWSWQLGLEGLFPERDHLGREFEDSLLRHQYRGDRLAGPFRFAFGGALGDWAFHTKFYYPYIHGSSHNYLCHRDCASLVIDSLRFQDFRPCAGVCWNCCTGWFWMWLVRINEMGSLALETHHGSPHIVNHY
jgi:hypothetical protein